MKTDKTGLTCRIEKKESKMKTRKGWYILSVQSRRQTEKNISRVFEI